MNTAEPNAMLRGGPAYLPLGARVRYVPDPGGKFKLLHGNHYDHFEPTQEIERSSGRDLRVFVWTGCTHVAE